MKSLHTVTFIFLIIGGLNWLAFGIFGWEVGRFLGGMTAMIPRVIYILVGISAVYEVFTHKNRCDNCSVKDMPRQTM